MPTVSSKHVDACSTELHDEFGVSFLTVLKKLLECDWWVFQLEEITRNRLGVVTDLKF